MALGGSAFIAHLVL
uniref:Uncharacterized protein n=1 Tax=Candida parapsilosis (strain CDC 317 / ATCC MYA-4646) TaxID=578454 RepID=A0AAJ8VX69_CANPC